MNIELTRPVGTHEKKMEPHSPGAWEVRAMPLHSE